MKVNPLSQEELFAIEKMGGTPIPANASLDYYLQCRDLKPLYSVAKSLGLVPSNVKKWADAEEGRYERIGLFAFGAGGVKKHHYVNVATFTRWALAYPNTRRQIVRHFRSEVKRIKKGMDRRAVLEEGGLFLFDELCSRAVIPKPFSSARGQETLLRHAREAGDSQKEMGLFHDATYNVWLVEPERFFRWLLETYDLVDS